MQKDVFGSVQFYGIIYYYLAANRRNLVCIDQRPTSRRRSTVNSSMDPAKLAKLQAQAASNRIGTSISATSGRVFAVCVSVCLSLSDWFADASARSGGKGTVRRKIVRKSKPSNTQDDKKLQGALKKLNVQPITGVEEVNMFREDGNVLHFSAPKGETLTCLSLLFFTSCRF
jgi:NAC domain